MVPVGRPRWQRLCVPVACLAGTLIVLWVIWGIFLPNAAGKLGVDYAIWLPDLLAGQYWAISSPVYALPWFNPSQCAGVPWHADPQGAYISLPQLLTFAVGPLRAIQFSFLAYAAAGFIGAWWLAERRFACSVAASLLAAALFTLNGFFAARMMVGHLSFAPFMLLPAMACCVLDEPPCERRVMLRSAGFAILFAIMLQAGMAVLVLPVFLSLAVMAVMHALATGGRLTNSVLRLTVGSVLGLALCAGKLVAVLALMAHVPRDFYPLPGLPDIARSAWLAFRCLFLWPTAAMTHELVNNALTLEPHEFDYRVGPAPLLLLAGGWLAWRRQPRAPARRPTRVLWEMLAVLLLIPLVLNTHAAAWTALLKHIPVLRSASSLLRWFAAYMLPAVLGAALALDRLSARAPFRWLGVSAAIALTCACLLLGDRAIYGPGGLGVYDPAPVAAAWRRVATSRRPLPIDRLAIPEDAVGKPDMSVARENLLTQGASPLFCYDALFGYRLEAFHQGTLHAGPVTDQTIAGARVELNLKNPACYVFPGVNGCAPGDTFLASQGAEAAAFAAWRPFAFARPWWAHAADWLSLVTLGGLALGVPWLLIRARR